MKRRMVPIVLVSLSLLWCSSAALADVKAKTYTLTPYIGGYLFEGNQNLESTGQGGPVYGLGLGYNVTPNWGAEASFDFLGTEVKHAFDRINMFKYRLDGLYHFQPEKKLVPYLAAGVGGIHANAPAGFAGIDKPFLNLGGGVKYAVFQESLLSKLVNKVPCLKKVQLRGDVRYILYEQESKSRNNLQYVAGLMFPFGGETAAPKPVAAPPPPPPAPVVAPPPPPPPAPVIAPPPPPPPAPEPAPVVVPPPPPLDSDKDGVPDDRDKCPGTPPGVAVDENGCPIDSDKDGVPDYLDKCPGTPPNTLVDANGCPLEDKITIGLVIEFDTAKAVVKPEYDDAAEKVALFMKTYPTVKGVIEGHTDNKGGKAYNMKLSQQRADAVKKMLVQKYGIESSRLTTKGYGFDRPVADNKTAEGRQKNRRINATFDTVTVTKKKK